MRLQCAIWTAESKRVRLADTLIDSLVDWLAPENAKVLY
jgi:hypothetical protein